MTTSIGKVETLYRQYSIQAPATNLKCESHSDGHLDGSGTHNSHIDEHSDRPND